MALPPAAFDPGEPGEAFLTLRFFLTIATPWADFGFLSAAVQAPLAASVRTSNRPKPGSIAGGAGVEIQIDPQTWVISAGEIRSTINLESGQWSDLSVRGKSLFRRGPLLNLWRAPLDSDGPFMRDWMAWALDRMHRQPLVARWKREPDGSIEIVLPARWNHPDGTALVRDIQTCRFLAGGSVRVRHSVEFLAKLPTLPRIGLRWRLAPEFDRADWYGRGPHECLSDRCRGALVGTYQSPIKDLSVPYIYPQENGMRCGVRRLQVTMPEGVALRCEASPEFTFSLRRCAVEDLARASHREELIERDFVELCLDHRHAGTGNTSLRAERFMACQVPAENTAWSFTLSVSRPGVRSCETGSGWSRNAGESDS